MNENKRQLGTLGETLAARYLQQCGYNILEKNFRCYSGEIDLIAEKEQLLIFVEVKLRNNLSCGWPEESITAAKQARIQRTAQFYLLQKFGGTSREIRMDVLTLLADKQQKGYYIVNHIKGAF